MKKFILAVFILLFVIACSTDSNKIKSPTHYPGAPRDGWATAQGVR